TMMAVSLHPADPDQIYSVARQGQVFGTRDGGKSWKEWRLPENVKDVYAVACAGGGSGRSGLRRDDDPVAEVDLGQPEQVRVAALPGAAGEIAPEPLETRLELARLGLRERRDREAHTGVEVRV